MLTKSHSIHFYSRNVHERGKNWPSPPDSITSCVHDVLCEILKHITHC